MSTSNTQIPQIQWTETGIVLPEESDILTGAFNDYNTAFGGNLRYDLRNSVGQLIQAETAIIGAKNDEIANFVNGVDPRTSIGRMQDGIGQIYFLTRIAASSTTVTARCYGAEGTIIYAGATAQDQAGNVYSCTNGGTIPAFTGYIELTFSCSTFGPIACPIGFLNKIYKAIPGWDSIDNLVAGTPGNDVETQQEFEARRRQSVALNGHGSLLSVLGAVVNTIGVTDAYVIQNTTGITTGAQATGSISTTTLTITAIADGTIALGQMVVGANVAYGTIITAFGTGTGGTGTYSVNISQTAASATVYCAFGGYRLLPNSIYVAAYGGASHDIADSIWNKMSPGCNFNGNTSVTITDDGQGLYTEPFPSYVIKFEIPAALAIKFNVSMALNSSVPADAIAQVKQAITNAFNGVDGGPKARIGSDLFASRFYSSIIALGSWAQIYSLLLGSPTANRSSFQLSIFQVPTLSDTNITVTFT
jgi:hypothetical protein